MYSSTASVLLLVTILAHVHACQFARASETDEEGAGCADELLIPIVSILDREIAAVGLRQFIWAIR